MLSSKDNNRNLMDVYVYDNLNRLTGVSGPGSMTMTYAANGNISSKTLVGNYTYGGSRPHAVTSVTNPGGLISTTTQRVTYTSFNKVDSIIQANLVYTVAYGKDDQRTISKLFDNGTLQKTVYYIGDYEKEVKPGNHTRQIHYISGGDGLTAIFVRNDGADTMYYVHPDYLGSLNVITNQSGSVVKTYCYDAWGRRRNPTDWTYSSIPSTFLFTRGYTGHEMLDEFSLINMNGRIYDPLLARFLNPDNFVQSPTSPQNYNRYSYCLNNPLKYTDPDGEFFIPMLIGAAISVITNGINNVVHDQAFFQGVGKAALIGGIGGAFSFGIGQAAMGMSGFGKVAFQTLAHGHLGGMMSGFNGGSYGSGFLSGAFGSLAATGTGSLLQNVNSKAIQGIGMIGGGAVSGGIGSELAGGNFWDGFRNGAISSGLNHGIHSGLFGEGLMMASITGRTRHLFGPDAISMEAVGDVSSGIGINLEKGGLFIMRGKDQGLYSLNDLGVGIGGISVSGGVEVMKYYDSAANVLKSHFYGNRYEGNLSLTVYGANVGVTGVVARHSDGFTIGYGSTFALDAIPFNIGFSLNKGVTTQSFYQLNTISNIFNSWW